MKTDLTKILSISGQHGLYRYLAQARGGAIVETLSDGKRTVAGAKNRITTLADISIYTTEGEIKLQEVFLKMREVLGEAPAPGSKADAGELKALFAKAVPDYDGDRFYVSHMRKVVEWYNEILQFASFDFSDPEEEETQETEEKAE
ncbi:MAG: DUF5606 domain-containing protein [Bacteroidales bacterium]|nr:DUF5606 domain-containing protein [Bacteroidales bacterium]